MATGDLTSVANAQAWVPQMTDATLAQRLVSAVSAQIKQYLSLDVLAGTYTETRNGCGEYRMMLRQIPVTSVTSVQIDGTSIQAAATATDYGFVFDDISVALRGFQFSRGMQNITITYAAGYASVPLDIEQAALDWIKMIWSRQFRDGVDLETDQAGPIRQTFTNGVLSVGDRFLGPMPGPIASALMPYQRVFPT